MNFGKSKKPQGRPVLSESQKSLIFAGLFRNVDFYRRVCTELPKLKFDLAKRHYKLLINHLLSFQTQYNKQPSQAEFVGHLEAALSVANVTPDEAHFLWELVRFIYGVADADVPSYDVLCIWFSQLVEEQLAQELQNSLMHGNHVHKDINGQLDSYRQRLGLAQSIVAPVLEEPFTGAWDVEEVKIRTPYGVDFIDRYLAGGGAPGETYLLLGPFGSCKTTLLTQLSISLAESKYYEYMRCPRGGLGLVYFVSYEESMKDMRIRALSNKTKIHRNVFEMEGFQSQLSSNGILNQRDLQYYGDAVSKGVYLPTETERMNRAISELNTNWRVLDLSSASCQGTGRGTGYISEVRNAIETDLRNQRAAGIPCYCAGVFVDYLELMIDNYMEYNPVKGGDKEMKFEMLKKSGDLFVRELASYFQTPVFVLHQLNKAGNEGGAGHVPHYTKASGCGSVGRGFAFVFVLSSQNEDGYCCVENQKHRYNKQLPTAILKVNGEICSVTWDQDKIYDSKTKEFISQADSESGVSKPIVIRNLSPLPE